MKKILVTGAGGFVGSRVMQQWAGHYELCTFPKGFLAAAGEDAVRQAIFSSARMSFCIPQLFRIPVTAPTTRSRLTAPMWSCRSGLPVPQRKQTQIWWLSARIRSMPV